MDADKLSDRIGQILFCTRR